MKLTVKEIVDGSNEVLVGKTVAIIRSNDPSATVGERFMVVKDAKKPLVSLGGKFQGKFLTSRYLYYAESRLCLGFETIE